MARVTTVKSAQQRYKTVPVIDPDTGKQKVIAVTGRNGQPKTDKHGRAITRRVTEPDKTRPLPPEHCDKCHKSIEPGDPYKWIAPKSGPYGGRRLVRCGTCPTWHRWEYSYSMGAQLERISYEAREAFGQGVDTEDDVRTILEEAAGSVRELASEKQESADNIESGFGHATSQSEELADIAEQLESWADDIENADIPEAPDESEYTDHEFDADEDGKCVECGEVGHEHDETYDDAMETWREEAEQVLDIIDESPV